MLALTEKTEFPVHESIQVLSGETIFRTDKWWMAVVKAKSFGRDVINVYLWVKRGDVWKRQQKMSVRDRETWEKVKKAIDKLF